MDNEKNIIDSKSSDTSEDITRVEESWTTENQQFLKNIRNNCLELSDRHGIASHYNKKKYICFSIPTIVLPLIVANLSIFLVMTYVTPVCLTIVSILNGMNVLFNYSKNSELHLQSSGLYAELASEISSILIRSKQFRQPFDITLQRITGRKKEIDGSALTI